MNKSEKKVHIICKYFLCDSVIDVIVYRQQSDDYGGS